MVRVHTYTAVTQVIVPVTHRVVRIQQVGTTTITVTRLRVHECLFHLFSSTALLALSNTSAVYHHTNHTDICTPPHQSHRHMYTTTPITQTHVQTSTPPHQSHRHMYTTTQMTQTHIHTSIHTPPHQSHRHMYIPISVHHHTNHTDTCIPPHQSRRHIYIPNHDQHRRVDSGQSYDQHRQVDSDIIT